MTSTVRWVIAGVAAFAIGGLAAYLWGGGAVDVFLAASLLWMLADRIGIGERLEDTRADVDQQGRDLADLTGDVNALTNDMAAVHAHLNDDNQPSTGRHSQQPATTPIQRPSPRPRRAA